MLYGPLQTLVIVLCLLLISLFIFLCRFLLLRLRQIRAVSRSKEVPKRRSGNSMNASSAAVSWRQRTVWRSMTPSSTRATTSTPATCVARASEPSTTCEATWQVATTWARTIDVPYAHESLDIGIHLGIIWSLAMEWLPRLMWKTLALVPNAWSVVHRVCNPMIVGLSRLCVTTVEKLFAHACLVCNVTSVSWIWIWSLGQVCQLLWYIGRGARWVC